MKTYNIAILALIVILLGTTTSCKKFLREELNDDPTSLNFPEPSVMLPAAQSNLAYYYGGDYARYSALLMQQVVGNGNQWAGYANYNFVDADFNNMWNGLFVTTLNNLDKAGKYAADEKMLHYEASCKILSGFTYSVLVDFFNDVPFTEALQGPVVLQPKYDNGSNVYASVFTMLDQGITLATAVDNGRVPGDDDFMFAGDMQSWIDFAHATKARMYLHLKDYPNAAAEAALANGVNATMVWNSPASGPMYQFNTNRAGDIVYIGSNAYDMMSAITGDDRIYSFVDTAGDALGPVFGSPQSPVYLISAMELKFIEAEVAARNGDANAATLLSEAVEMSFDMTGDVTGLPAALAAYPYNAADPASARLATVMNHKYMAMFLQPESFADWRRTGVPTLVPASGSAIPRRFLYPTDEKAANPNTPKGITLLGKVFWDN